MKRIITMIFLMALMIISLIGCAKEPVEVKVTIKNSTGYELETVSFQIPQTSGSYSPMHDLVTPEDGTLKPNEQREAVTWLYESDFGNEGWSFVFVKDDETKYEPEGIVSLSRGKNSFEITCGDEMNFITRAIED